MREWEKEYGARYDASEPHQGWFREGKVVVPPDLVLKRRLMGVYHDRVTAGHPGHDETFHRTAEHYWWPGMRTWVEEYVAGCALCQQTKIITHKRCTPLYKIPTWEEAQPFQQVAMDLITSLPRNGPHDAILTIVDHGCSQAALFLLCSTEITGPGIAQLYLDHVYRWFCLPLKVISDIDPRFTSHFGRALAQKLGVEQNLSSAFHPQTDGLSERKNHWIEQYLRHLTCAQQDDWSQWLAIAFAVHNDRSNSTLGISPNEALLGYRPILYPNQVIPSKNDT